MKMKGLRKELRLQRNELYKQKRNAKVFSAHAYELIGRVAMINDILKLISEE